LEGPFRSSAIFLDFGGKVRFAGASRLAEGGLEKSRHANSSMPSSARVFALSIISRVAALGRPRSPCLRSRPCRELESRDLQQQPVAIINVSHIYETHPTIGEFRLPTRRRSKSRRRRDAAQICLRCLPFEKSGDFVLTSFGHVRPVFVSDV